MSRIKWFDAIRAFGLLLVLGYHLFYNWLPGGFLGVDVFFTFSGFLITSLIMEEVRKKSRFSLAKFYVRRFQRIFIPLALSIVITLPFLLFISPDFTVHIDKQIAGALSFTTNWREIMIGSSYEAQLLPSLYLHTWALSVGMQFYLAWGLLCALLALLSKAIRKNDDIKRYTFFKTFVRILSFIIAVGSYSYMQYSYHAGTVLDTIYFNTFTRFFPFFIGAFAAAVWRVEDKQDALLEKRYFSKNKKLKASILIAFIISAMLVIVFYFSQHKFADAFVYRYGFLLTSLLTIVLIYSTHGLHLITPQKKNHSNKLKALADLSYDVYLFHWPLYIVFSALLIDHTIASLVTLVTSFVFSAFMVYGAERVLIPQNNTGSIKHKKIVVSILCVTVVGASSAGVLVFIKAPAITSIEADFASGYTLMDTSSVFSLGQSIRDVNNAPIIQSGQNGALQIHLLPEPTEPNTSASGGISTQETDLLPEPSVTITSGVTLIGDSAPLGAQAAMIDLIPDIYVDAEVGRRIDDGIAIIQDLQSRNELREYVVIALGTNGANNYEELMIEMIDEINPGHKLIFVTPFDGRPNENARVTDEIADWMRELPNQYDFIVIADWNSRIGAQVHLLASDRVHAGGQGSKNLYAECVAEALEAASLLPGKG